MKLNTHFVVVWDCDAASKEKELRGQLPRGARVTPFAFPKRGERGIPDHGIENSYDEEILKPFSNTVMDPEGTVVRREVPNDRKTEFANHVLREGTHRYFAIVSGILEAPD